MATHQALALVETQAYTIAIWRVLKNLYFAIIYKVMSVYKETDRDPKYTTIQIDMT